MPLTILFILVGAFLLYLGGNWLVVGSSSFALRRGVSKLVVGLTIVAFGTSAPELFISSMAALRGSSSIAIGNIIGSNIANIGLILGFAALIYPPRAQHSTIRFQIPFAIGITVIFIVLTLNGMLGRFDALVLLACFGFFTWYCLRFAGRDVFVDEGISSPLDSKAREILFILLGLAFLAGGSDIFVRGAIRFARFIGVSEFFIGLSLVALGTSLPELATSIIAAIKKESEIVVGNVIGSCIFNILLVLGVVGMIHPISGPDIAIWVDYGVMLFVTLLLFPMLFTGRRLSRMEGMMLLAVYAGYIIYIALRE